MTTTSRSAALRELHGRLRRTSNTARQLSLSPEDVLQLASALGRGTSSDDQSLAYICLTQVISTVSGSTEDDKTANLTAIFLSILDSVRQATELKPEQCIPAANLLTSLFPLAPGCGIAIIATIIGSEDDAPDLMAILLEMAELESELQIAFAELLASMAGTKLGRDLVRSRALEWLTGALHFGGRDAEELGSLSAVALSKLSREEVVPGQEPTSSSDVNERELCDRMIALIGSQRSGHQRLIPILEGLSILSTKPAIKEYMISHPSFLRSLLALSPVPTPRGGSLPVTPRSSLPAFDEDKLFQPVETSLCYGLTTVLCNLSARKAVLSAEDKQVAQLKAMAISGKKGAAPPPDDPLDEPLAVRARVRRLYAGGVVPALSGLVRAESRLVKTELGRLCLNLVEERSDRPSFIKDGGFKILSAVVRDLTNSKTGKTKATDATGTPQANLADSLPSVQAFAKLIITTPPPLLFPPPHTTTALNALMPLYTLLTHPASTLLQTFEALMALTNLASIEASIADRIVTAHITPSTTDDGMWRGSGREDRLRIMTKVEECILDDNTLVRRAGTELVCNLAGCEKGFGYFSGEDSVPADSSDRPAWRVDARVRSRLHVLLVLANSDDLPTRLAAGGALAIITESPVGCFHLLQLNDVSNSDRDDDDSSPRTKTIWQRLVSLLEPEEVEEDGEKIALISSTPPDEGMILRAVCILVNLARYVVGLDKEQQAVEAGRIKAADTTEKVSQLLSMNFGEEVLRPAVEALQIVRKLR